MNTNRTLKAILCSGCIIAGMLSSNNAFAQGIPVYDNTQYINQMKEIAHMLEQLEQAKKQYEAVTGGRGMGSLELT